MSSAVKNICEASSGAAGDCTWCLKLYKVVQSTVPEEDYSRGEWNTMVLAMGIEISGHGHIVKLLGQAELMELLLILLTCVTSYLFLY